MSTPPEPAQPPAHLRPLTVAIPRTWTPEEALAVFELIDELRDKICALYNARGRAAGQCGGLCWSVTDGPGRIAGLPGCVSRRC
jgi:hypothetical protein